MKKRLLLCCLVFCFVLTGCTRSITYETFKQKIKDGSSMIVEVVQDGCSHCEKFEPVFSKFIKDNNLEYVKLNITHMSDDDYQELNANYGVDGTPMVLFIKNGKELSEYRISGEAPVSDLEDTFKKAGYIK